MARGSCRCATRQRRSRGGELLRLTPAPPRVQPTEASEQYQLQKMRCLRDINVDSNTVGWYQSAPYSDFQTVQLIETFISYEESVKKCVCIVCDVKDSQQGALALKAVGLNRKFMELYKKNPNVRATLRCRHHCRLPVHAPPCTLRSARGAHGGTAVLRCVRVLEASPVSARTVMRLRTATAVREACGRAPARMIGARRPVSSLT
jgi:hypothetical protein